HCIDLELPFVFLSGSFRNHARSPPLFEDTGFSLCLQIGVRTKLYQAGFPLDAGTTYRLSFSAYSTSGHNMAMFLQRQTSPYTNYGLNNWVVDLTTAWKYFSRVFTTTGFAGTTSDSRLRFWFAPYDAAGDKFYLDNVVLEKASLAKGIVPVEVPTDFALHQNYPNPFNPTTAISYDLPVALQVSLRVYDLLGKEVATLVDEIQDAGYKSVEFDASTLASGVYFYRLQTGEFISVKKMIVTK
ncbi:MAG: T9SS type A sorting domain-containing protein, partial [Bacteroidota bacterium]